MDIQQGFNLQEAMFSAPPQEKTIVRPLKDNEQRYVKYSQDGTRAIDISNLEKGTVVVRTTSGKSLLSLNNKGNEDEVALSRRSDQQAIQIGTNILGKIWRASERNRREQERRRQEQSPSPRVPRVGRYAQEVGMDMNQDRFVPNLHGNTKASLLSRKDLHSNAKGGIELE